MKITITFKDSDGVYESIRDAARQTSADIDGLSHSEREELEKSRHKSINEKLGKWIEYGEYVHIEFDTEMMTARVLEIGK